MAACNSIQRRLGDLAALPQATLPPEVREHVAGCAACARALAGARLARGLLAAAAGMPEPPEDFAGRVLRSLPPAPAPRRAGEDPWAPAWGLLPAFAAAAAALLLLLQFQVRDLPRQVWPDADQMLASVEEGAR